MAGVTDSAFRLINKLGGADLVYSEMAHVNAVSYNSKKTLQILKASPFEFPYIIQLFGKDPQYFAKAAKIISTKGVPVMRYKPFGDKQRKLIEKMATDNRQLTTFYSRFLDFQEQLQNTPRMLPVPRYSRPSGLDINLGCPAKKVFGHGGGAALWNDLKNVRAILKAVSANTDLPVSIKVRTAVGDVTLFDLLDAVEDLPIKRVMIHGRTYAQGFSGPIDTKFIRQVIKKYPQFEIWVNGGIIDYASAQKVIKTTGCRNLGIARGTYGNPLMAEEIKQTAGDRKIITGAGSRFNPEPARRIKDLRIINQCLIAYIHSLLACQSKGRRGIIEMRKHLAWYFKDFPGAKNWRQKLVRVEKIQDVEKLLSEIAKI